MDKDPQLLNYFLSRFPAFRVDLSTIFKTEKFLTLLAFGKILSLAHVDSLLYQYFLNVIKHSQHFTFQWKLLVYKTRRLAACIQPVVLLRSTSYIAIELNVLHLKSYEIQSNSMCSSYSVIDCFSWNRLLYLFTRLRAFSTWNESRS